ncbi:DASH family cryptochrome [Methylomonas sp. 2BW1-5-20]|uniref:DASH family cryptochrome n=1 Tax=Methylomonas sp. 2BW1-5-20 TaxID=3376686 RepID=UPI00404ED620
MRRVGLYWFGNDLRVRDNANLQQAGAVVDQLLCVYCLDPQWLSPNQYGLARLSPQRWRFLKEALQDLDKNLQQAGQRLLVCYDAPVTAIGALVAKHGVSVVYRSRHCGFQERQQWLALQQHIPGLRFIESDTHTLFNLKDLPFAQLPPTFTQFKELVEHLPVDHPLPAADALPPCPEPKSDWLLNFPVYLPASYALDPDLPFHGGETAGNKRLKTYFHSGYASRYKDLRDELDGWENSTKFSPWLAHGNLSVRKVHADLRRYEHDHGANESTYWLYLELLWREYFQWYAHQYGKRLFAFRGITQRKPLTCFYAERFQKWCQGNTPFPLVNACMKQLNATGFMSNRGRQIAASCLVNELELDWRFGAAYFEQQLLDYDVASNWGNWQYLAGVGADPRGKRHFDLAKQSRLYDPHGKFIRSWQAEIQNLPLDSVDAADWPVDPAQTKSVLPA